MIATLTAIGMFYHNYYLFTISFEKDRLNWLYSKTFLCHEISFLSYICLFLRSERRMEGVDVTHTD